MSSFFLLRTGLPRISTFFPYTTLFRSHLGVGRAQRVDGESLGEGPAGVVVGILLRIVRGPVLIVEQRVGDARVRLVHADDVTARGKLPNLGGFHRPRRTTIGCSRAPRPASR